jgi:hypothetical protein
MVDNADISEELRMFNKVELIQKSWSDGKTIDAACREHKTRKSDYYEWLKRYIRKNNKINEEKKESAKFKEKGSGVLRGINDNQIIKTKDQLYNIITLALSEKKAIKLNDFQQISKILSIEKDLFDKYENGVIPKSIILIEVYFFKLFKTPYFLENLKRLCEFESEDAEYLWNTKKEKKRGKPEVINEIYRVFIDFHESLLNHDKSRAGKMIRKLRHLFIKFNKSGESPCEYFNFEFASHLEASTINLKIISDQYFK